MGRLLRADLARLKKSRLFLICLFIQAVFTLFVIIVKFPAPFILEDILVSNGLISLLLSSVCAPAFIYTDIGDGTVRNKIITGHSRISIYTARFLGAAVGTGVITIAPAVLVLLPAIALGWLGTSPAVLLIRVIISLAANFAMCGICSAVVQMFRSSGMVASVVIAFAMFLISDIALLKVEFPEETYETELEQALFTSDEDTRWVWKGLYDILPTSHFFRGMLKEPVGTCAVLPAYSLAAAGAAWCLGTALFVKEDIK